MTVRPAEELIAVLAEEAGPVRPLPPPQRRALSTLAGIAAAGALVIMLLSDPSKLSERYEGREGMMMLEMLAILATGVLAVTGAFFLAVPGRSKRWLLAPAAPLLAWIGIAGWGCYEHLVRSGGAGWELGESIDCLVFIVGASLAIALPLVWRLARARPIDPLPVALLAGLGTAALSAFALQFFHPFAVTFLDLGVHLVAVAIVVGVMALLNRRALAPA